MKGMRIRKFIANRAPLFDYDKEYLKKYKNLKHEKMTLNQRPADAETDFDTDYFTSIDSIYYPGVLESIIKNKKDGYVVSNVTPSDNGVYYYYD